MSKIQTLPSLRPPARLHLPAIGAGILDRALPWLLPVGLFLLWWLAARHH